jgi:putative transposase
VRLPLPLFDRSDFLVYDGELLRLDQEWEDGSLALTRVRSHRPFLLADGSPPTADWFHAGWATGALCLMSSRRQPGRPPAHEPAPNSRKAQRAVTVQAVCTHLDQVNCPRSDAAIARALIALWTPEFERVHGERPPASTVRKWLARTFVDQRTLAGCAPRNGEGPRRARLDSAVLDLRTDAALFFWSERSVSVEDAYAELIRNIKALNKDRVAVGLKPVKACSKEWLRVRIRELENRTTYACKYGERAAAARFDANGLGALATQVLEICSIDNHTWDSLCGVDEVGEDLLLVGRPSVTAMFDHHTGCILAAQVHACDPCLGNMLDAVKAANRPKLTPTRIGSRFGKNDLLASIFGKPDTILPDNAWEFVGVSAQDSFLDLGLSVDWTRAGQPQDKALLERFWRFLSMAVARKLPAAVYDPKLMRQLGYDPGKVRPVLLSDLRELVAEAVAFWHLKPYKRLGCPPAAMWERAVRRRGGIPVIRDDSKLDQLMGEVRETTLTTSGIILFDRTYTDRASVGRLLNNLVGCSPRGRVERLAQTARVRVKVKFNPADLSRAHVYDRTTGEYVALTCTDPHFAGLSTKHVDALRAYAELRNQAFMSREDTAIARAMLNDFIRDASPGLALRHRRKFAQLVSKGVGADTVGGVVKAHAPSSYSGMLPVIEHQPAMLTRTDAGRPPKGPSPRRAKPKRTTPARREPRSASKSLQISELSTADEGDWSGLV